jgi:uncharacterized protein YgbK (DUF1537 family)
MQVANDLGIDDDEAGESEWASCLTGAQLAAAIVRMRPEAEKQVAEICEACEALQ